MLVSVDGNPFSGINFWFFFKEPERAALTNSKPYLDTFFSTRAVYYGVCE